jgi:ATP adenylyltransferase
LVLNKFPIIPSHFILVTKTNKAQTAALEPEDLEASYACLRAWENGGSGRRLYGFFNGGEHSGASQAHRHLQFVPVEGMKQGDEKDEWDVLMNQIVEKDAEVPFEVFWQPIPPETSKEELHAIYTKLYDQAQEVVEKFAKDHPEDLELHDTSDGTLPFSYNLGMTTRVLMLLPRRREGSILRDANGTDIGFAAFNGTVLAGTMMVKKQEEWDLLRGNNDLLNELLRNIGIPQREMVSKDARI